MQSATEQKWTAYIEQQQKSNLTVAQFCQQIHISPSTFYQRKRELNQQSSSNASFIKATVTQQVEVETACAPLLLSLGNVTLSLPSQTPADYIVSLINGISS